MFMLLQLDPPAYQVSEIELQPKSAIVLNAWPDLHGTIRGGSLAIDGNAERHSRTRLRIPALLD